MASNTIELQRCPCGARNSGGNRRGPVVSLVMQLGTIGCKERRRSHAVTVYPCDECLARLAHSRTSALLRILARRVFEMRRGMVRKGGNRGRLRKATAAR